MISGERSIEVRPYGCNYTTMLKRILNKNSDVDFLLYIGEFPPQKSEIPLGPEAKVYTVGVGNKEQGNYLISSTEDVLQLLEKLVS